VLEGDPLSASRESIGELEVWMTIVGGSVAWSRESAAQAV
jgi:hypothetical protein